MTIVVAGSLVLVAVVYAVIARISARDIRRNAAADVSHEPDEEVGQPDENTPPWMRRLP